MADSAARMAGVQLRRAEQEDAASIARLHIASWRAAYSAELPSEYLAALDEGARAEQWRSRLARPTTQVLLAETAGELLGFCAHGPGQATRASLTSIWEIYGLHVLPQRRGRGIGSVLFGEAVRSACQADAQVLTLWVVATNAPARRFYEGKGMQPDGGAKDRELAPGITLHEVRYSVTPLTPAATQVAR